MQSRACAHTCVYVSARAHLSAPKGAVRTVFWVVVAEEVVLEDTVRKKTARKLREGVMWKRTDPTIGVTTSRRTMEVETK